MTVQWKPLNGLQAGLVAEGYLGPNSSMEYSTPYFDTNYKYWYFVIPTWTQTVYPQSIQIESVRVKVTGTPTKFRAYVKVKNTAPPQLVAWGDPPNGCSFEVWALEGWV